MAAELNRRGAFATLYLTNTPRVDIVAMAPDGRQSVNIQVKTKGSTSKSWQWQAERAEQEREAPASDYMVLVDLQSSQPDYYVWPLRVIADKCYARHQAWIKSHGGQRPRTPGSQHMAIYMTQIEAGKDAWHLLGVIPAS